MTRPEHHTGELSGVGLHYLAAGNGPALVLLHGWPQSSHEWRHLTPALAAGGERSIGAAVKLCMQQVASDVRGGALERCGHWIAEEQPQALLDELTAFLGQG